MPANMVLLEKITVGSAGASSVTFSGIPQTGYTDLVVKFAARGDAGAISRSIALTFNGSATSYSSRYLQGDGSAASSGTGGSTNIYAGECTASTATASTFANQELYIPNYASSNYKSVSVDSVAETNATTQYMGLQAGLWSNTAAITSIGLAPGTGNFAQYSTFYLYGVAKLGTTPAIVPYATGGDTIMTDGTYWYHTFISSGTFTPQKALSCDYLVVAGGGAGGVGRGGGGGAGGLRSTVTATGGGGSLESKLSLGTSAYTIAIGAGGAKPTQNSSRAGDGSNSSISGSGITTVTSNGGGAGANQDFGATNSTVIGNAGTTGNSNGFAGGSGGGGGARGESETGGSGTTNQGFAGGGSFFVASPVGTVAGGGGGAGAAGQTPTVTTASGNGGNGVAVSITGSSVTYAGGGGGASEFNSATLGTGGTGGGGAGAISGSGNNGGVNLGGGGGGGTDATGTGNTSSGSGGSGIVIIRYAV